MTWILWAMMLLAQQGSSTWTSRAKSQDNTKKLAVASFFGNLIWFVSQVIIVDNVSSALKSHEYFRIGYTAFFYTFFCVGGNVLAHKILIYHEGRVKI